MCGTRSSTLGRRAVRGHNRPRTLRRLRRCSTISTGCVSSMLDAINAVLVAYVRAAEGRNAEPTAGIINSHSVETTETDGPPSHYLGKKIRVRKRHIVTDTVGNMLNGLDHPADGQNRDDAPALTELPGHISLARPNLCRWRLRRAKAGKCDRASRSLHRRDHQAF